MKQCFRTEKICSVFCVNFDYDRHEKKKKEKETKENRGIGEERIFQISLEKYFRVTRDGIFTCCFVEEGKIFDVKLKIRKIISELLKKSIISERKISYANIKLNCQSSITIFIRNNRLIKKKSSREASNYNAFIKNLLGRVATSYDNPLKSFPSRQFHFVRVFVNYTTAKRFQGKNIKNPLRKIKLKYTIHIYIYIFESISRYEVKKKRSVNIIFYSLPG